MTTTTAPASPVYFCCSPNCPGLPYRASERQHPSCFPFAGTDRKAAAELLVPAEFAANLSPNALAKLELFVAYHTNPAFAAELRERVAEMDAYTR